MFSRLGNLFSLNTKKQLLIIAVLSALVLFFIVNYTLPYEQDQGSKAAKIILMVKNNTIFQPTSPPNIYNDSLFSFFYVFSAFIYKLIPINIFQVMNLLSVAFGVIFFTSIACLLKLDLDINPYLSWVIFISMPILTTTFQYGNEAALSLTLFILSLLFMAFSFQGNWIISIILLVAGVFSRPDILLLMPFWLGWDLLFHQSGKINRQVFYKYLKFFGFFLFISSLYFVIFIHSLQIRSLSFTFHTNIKLLLSYLTYPFNLTNVILGFLGWIFLLKKNYKLALVLAALILDLLFYINNLASPKYIIGLTLFFGISVAYLITQFRVHLKIPALAMIAVWYFVSISPFGLFLFDQGSGVYIPTADGAIPSGSYLWFYHRVRDGFFQLKYQSEIQSFREAMNYIYDNPDQNTVIVGSFNTHFAYTGLSLSSQDINILDWMNKHIYLVNFPDGNSIHYLMLQRSYLAINKMTPVIKGKFLQYLEDGRVRSLRDDNSPFPQVIEIGDSLPKGYNNSLAQRILFATEFYRGNGILHSPIWYDYYRPTYWVNANESLPINGIEPIYIDQEWMVYDSKIDDGQTWILELPEFYQGEQDPNQY